MSETAWRLPKLYIIVDRATLDARGLGVGAFARELREAGVTLVQYRDKVGGPREILGACAEIAAAFEGSGATLILNDRADLAALAGWDGVHVGQGDLGVADVRRVLGGDGRSGNPLMRDKATHEWGTRKRGWVVGVSTHGEEQVRAVEAFGAGLRQAHLSDDETVAKVEHPVAGEAEHPLPEANGPDYVAIGPVFGTLSKAYPEPVVGPEGVRRARALTRRPLVAIGGITRENARSVMDAGADSVAVIGGLFREGQTVADVARDFLRILG